MFIKATMWPFLYQGLGLSQQTQRRGGRKTPSNYPPGPCSSPWINKYSWQTDAAGSLALLSRRTPSGHTDAFEWSICQRLPSSSLVTGLGFFGLYCSRFFVSTWQNFLKLSFVKCKNTWGANSQSIYSSVGGCQGKSVHTWTKWLQKNF